MRRVVRFGGVQQGGVPSPDAPPATDEGDTRQRRVQLLPHVLADRGEVGFGVPPRPPHQRDQPVHHRDKMQLLQRDAVTLLQQAAREKEGRRKRCQLPHVVRHQVPQRFEVVARFPSFKRHHRG